MRVIWKGALSFGLINIPVNLYTATRERELKFVLLHKPDLSEIRYARFCKAEGKEVPYNEIVKGYEVSDGNYVVLSDEDFKRATLEKSKNIDILEFCNEDEIDTIYYDKLYYLEPGKNANKAYTLLHQALQRSKKVAVAKFVLKNHERIAVVRPYQNLLILNQIRLPSEILKPNIDIPEEGKIPEKEMNMALKLIDQLTEKFSPKKFKDTYVEDLKEIIAKKEKGGKKRKKAVKEPAPSKVHDIMELLKESLEKEHVQKGKRKKSA